MRRAAPWLTAGAGTALVLAGVVVSWWANTARWITHGGGHEPLVPGGASAYESRLVPGVDGAVLWTWRHTSGAGLVVLGLLVPAGVGGWLLGRQAGRRAAG
ncbi:hypothetical protein ACI78Q_18690 [Geodermatophilus sp. SYSU D00705]